MGAFCKAKCSNRVVPGKNLGPIIARSAIDPKSIGAYPYILVDTLTFCLQNVRKRFCKQNVQLVKCKQNAPIKCLTFCGQSVVNYWPVANAALPPLCLILFLYILQSKM